MDAIAKERAAGLALGRIDAHHTHRLVGKVDQEASHELVDQRRLAGAAGTGNAEDRHLRFLRARANLGQVALARLRRVLRRRDGLGDGAEVALQHPVDGPVQGRAGGEVALFDQVVDHPLQAHRAPVVGRINARDAVLVQLFDLVGENHTTAAAEDADV